MAWDHLSTLPYLFHVQFWKPNTNFFGVRDIIEDQPLELTSRIHLPMQVCTWAFATSLF